MIVCVSVGCVTCEHIWVCVSAWVTMGVWVSVWACVSLCVQVCVSQSGCVDECEGACFMEEMGEFVGTCLPVRARYTYPGALEQSCGCCKQVLGLSYRFCPSPLPATSKSKPLLPAVFSTSPFVWQAWLLVCFPLLLSSILTQSNLEGLMLSYF